MVIAGAFMGWIAVMGLPVPSGYLPVDYDQERGFSWTGFRGTQETAGSVTHEFKLPLRHVDHKDLKRLNKNTEHRKPSALDSIHPEARELKLVRWGDL